MKTQRPDDDVQVAVAEVVVDESGETVSTVRLLVVGVAVVVDAAWSPSPSGQNSR